MSNPLYGSNSFDKRVGERLFTEAGTGREHENSTDLHTLPDWVINCVNLDRI